MLAGSPQLTLGLCPDGTPSEQYQILLYEKRLSGGSADDMVVRQTSDIDEPGSGGKYEYLLPAVPRQYNISVTSYTNADISFALEDYEVKGDEKENNIDFHLKPQP